MIQSISHERARGDATMSAATLTTPSVRPFGNFQSPKQRRETGRRDNCDYCEFSGARNYVNEVEEREKGTS